MQFVSAYDARRRFSVLLNRSRTEPVAITRYNRPAAYLISAGAFREFQHFRRKAQLEEMTRLVARLKAAGDSAAPGLFRELDKLTKQVDAEHQAARGRKGA
jgi:prevent-host-death family protein